MTTPNQPPPRPVEEIAKEICEQWPIGKSVIHGLIAAALQSERSRADRAERERDEAELAYQQLTKHIDATLGFLCSSAHSSPELIDRAKVTLDEAIRVIGVVRHVLLAQKMAGKEVFDHFKLMAKRLCDEEIEPFLTTLADCRAARDLRDKIAAHSGQPKPS